MDTGNYLTDITGAVIRWPDLGRRWSETLGCIHLSRRLFAITAPNRGGPCGIVGPVSEAHEKLGT